jgi:hypothetical protein
MFQNRITGLVPNLFIPPFNAAMPAGSQDVRTPDRSPQAVQIADIYQAAVNRAIEDHEIDKLFNPEYYDYQI